MEGSSASSAAGREPTAIAECRLCLPARRTLQNSKSRLSRSFVDAKRTATNSSRLTTRVNGRNEEQLSSPVPVYGLPAIASHLTRKPRSDTARSRCSSATLYKCLEGLRMPMSTSADDISRSLSSPVHIIRGMEYGCACIVFTAVEAAIHGHKSPRCAWLVSGQSRLTTLMSSSLSGQGGVRRARGPWSRAIMFMLAIMAGGLAAIARATLSVLPPDFGARWNRLLHEPGPEEMMETPESHGGTTIYDCQGIVLAKIVSGNTGTGGPGSRHLLRPQDIPSSMWQAAVACEDRRFFEHCGVDYRGLSRALFSMSNSGGGSTITQQLVKNIFLTHERHLARKAAEIVLAFLLERKLSKWEILLLYLSKIYWGHGVYGLEGASNLYFNKPPSKLSIGDCALLAGIIPAPELLSPFRDPSRGKKPQARALRRMVEAGFLDSATAESLVAQPLVLARRSGSSAGAWRAPYFVSEVLFQLHERYGVDEILSKGLKVHTTLDIKVQEATEKVFREWADYFDRERTPGLQRRIARLSAAVDYVSRCVAKDPEDEELAEKLSQLQVEVKRAMEEAAAPASARLQGAIVAMEAGTGAIRILVGGRDYYESPFNRATQALRAPGSTFKPIVYLTALADGKGKNYALDDSPLEVQGYTFENFDRKFRGEVKLSEALIQSLNVPTVRLCQDVGVHKVIQMAHKLGIDNRLPHELSLSLGSCEVTPAQLATAYSTIAAGGVYAKPHMITRVLDCKGEVLEEQRVDPKVVVREPPVTKLRELLEGVVKHGTGSLANLGKMPSAGKTGTTDGHRDVWFAGFTPYMVSVVWLGYDDNSPVGGEYHATGATTAAPVWRQLMLAAHENLQVKQFQTRQRDFLATSNVGGRRHRKRKPDGAVKADENGKQQKAAVVADARATEAVQETDTYDGTLGSVWDWEAANNEWLEKEKMVEWVASRRHKAESRLPETTAAAGGEAEREEGEGEGAEGAHEARRRRGHHPALVDLEMERLLMEQEDGERPILELPSSTSWAEAAERMMDAIPRREEHLFEGLDEFERARVKWAPTRALNWKERVVWNKLQRQNEKTEMALARLAEDRAAQVRRKKEELSNARSSVQERSSEDMWSVQDVEGRGAQYVGEGAMPSYLDSFAPEEFVTSLRASGGHMTDDWRRRRGRAAPATTGAR